MFEHRRWASIVVGCWVATSSCSGGSGHLIDPPPADADTIRVFGPELEVPAGAEQFICYTAPIGNTEAVFVDATHVFQTDGGHHVLVLSVDADALTVDEPHECTPEDMNQASLRFIGAGTAAGSGIELPPETAMRIEPGRRLLLQAHYVNGSGGTLRAQDAIDLHTVPEA